MDASYMLACGIVWRKTADPEAGWELVEALESRDPRLRLLAQSLLVENGEDSMELLESAVTGGIVSPEVAGPCMAEILRSRQSGPVDGPTSKQPPVRSWLC
ncbi:MAG: hypothetical protein LAO24_03965 [Acidobacteriia bacterium]|nr:hypothetical protein [Terriglobia bacterium]